MNRLSLKFTLIITLIVTSYISFILVAVNAGIDGNFLFFWFRSWLIAYIIAVPSLLCLSPFIKKNCPSNYVKYNIKKEIDVLALNPGLTDTEMTANYDFPWHTNKLMKPAPVAKSAINALGKKHRLHRALCIR